jgi:hypothetical protein
MAEYKIQSGSAREFLERYCEYCPTGPHGESITVGWRLDTVYKSYKEWCTHPKINGDLAKDKQFGAQVNKFCPGAKFKKERDEKGNQSKQYFGFMFFEEKYKEDMKSISAPFCSIDSPSKTVSSPSAPLNEQIWNSIREKSGAESNMINHDTILLSEYPIEQNMKKRPVNGANGDDIDSNDTIKIVNGAPTEKISKFNGAATGEAARPNDDADFEDEGPSTGKIDRPTPESKKTRWAEEKPSSEQKDCGSCDVTIKGDKTTIKCEDCSFLRKETEADTLKLRFLKSQVEPYKGPNIPRFVLHPAGSIIEVCVEEAQELIAQGIAELVEA